MKKKGDGSTCRSHDTDYKKTITMNKCNITNVENQYAYTSILPLTAIGAKTRKMKLFGPIEREVKIAQKIIKHRPVDKLMDGYIAILAGAAGMAEVNKRVRSERAVQVVFGRKGCAEQSVVQDQMNELPLLSCCSSNCKTNLLEIDLETTFKANADYFSVP